MDPVALATSNSAATAVLHRDVVGELHTLRCTPLHSERVHIPAAVRSLRVEHYSRWLRGNMCTSYLMSLRMRFLSYCCELLPTAAASSEEPAETSQHTATLDCSSRGGDVNACVGFVIFHVMLVSSMCVQYWLYRNQCSRSAEARWVGRDFVAKNASWQHSRPSYNPTSFAIRCTALICCHTQDTSAAQRDTVPEQQPGAIRLTASTAMAQQQQRCTLINHHPHQQHQQRQQHSQLSLSTSPAQSTSHTLILHSTHSKHFQPPAACDVSVVVALLFQLLDTFTLG